MCVQVLNADVQPRSYWAVVSDAQAVSLQVSIVASVLEMHHLLLTGGIGIQAVLLLVVALICFGRVFVWRITGYAFPLSSLNMRALSCAVVLLGTFSRPGNTRCMPPTICRT